MNAESIRGICKKLPDVTEDVKWGADLCFLISEKMFCVTGLDGPFGVSFKVTDEEFGAMSTRVGIIPAPYVARYKWVMVQDPKALTKKEWELFITQSYELVKSKLPKKKVAKKKK